MWGLSEGALHSIRPNSLNEEFSLFFNNEMMCSVCQRSTRSFTTTTRSPGPASGSTRWTSGADTWPACTGRPRHVPTQVRLLTPRENNLSIHILFTNNCLIICYWSIWRLAIFTDTLYISISPDKKSKLNKGQKGYFFELKCNPLEGKR